MLIQIRIQFGSQSRFNSSYYSLLNPLCTQKPNLPKYLTPTIEMVTESGSTKRKMCPNCSKPTRICLCTRLKTPALQNSIAVTILQHDLEKNHPLNSTRIATIGLKDVRVTSVSDVNFQARFCIHLLDPDHNSGPGHLEEKISDFIEIGSGKRNMGFVQRNVSLSGFQKSSDFGGFSGKNGAVIAFTIEKYGAFKSFYSHWMLSSKEPDQCQKRNKFFDHLLESKEAVERLGKGFVVKKLQTKKLEEEFEEFEINVHPGSILLFPSEKSVGIEDIDFEVKNLIVLDGTWAKAKRMYNENPWLQLLPHLKLDLDKLSLYSEVRHQPRPGCLSTIESIVYALKAFGENSEKLDDLLDVFESMVGDQRRCKDERLSRVTPAI